MKKVKHINILLIGRTRTGKSTINALVVDPTQVPDALTLKSGTREPRFQSFHMAENDVVLNIIDTPGLFEHDTNKVDVRDNDTILRTIGMCMNMEITKFHVICFCVSLTTGVNREDIESLHAWVKYLGLDASKNSCLIITRCESIDEEQRERLKRELSEDMHFKVVRPFFKLGIFFSGAISRDDLERGNDSVYKQFFTINDYRENLIELFLSVRDPIPLERMAATSPDFAKQYHTLLGKINRSSKLRRGATPDNGRI